MSICIQGPKIYTEQGILTQQNLLIEQDKIADISNKTAGDVLTFPDTYHAIPGFIDMHIHGSAGADVMDGTPAALKTICDGAASVGTTAFLATTMSEPAERIDQAMKTIAAFDNNTGAEIIGVHLEGPFISKSYKGAQAGSHLLDPDIALFERWQAASNHQIKLVTVAPELNNALPFIQYLAEQNIIASVGHSEADYEQTNLAIDAGCSHATHLFNAMGKLHHRSPSTAGALLLSNKVMAELVADGNHLHPAFLELTYRIKGPEKCVLVTDATRARCMPEGEYDLGGQAVFVKDGKVTLANGTIAGSIVTQWQAAKNMQTAVNCDLQELIQLTSVNPAKALNIYDRKGSLTPGKDADIVILDENLNHKMTIARGKPIH